MKIFRVLLLVFGAVFSSIALMTAINAVSISKEFTGNPAYFIQAFFLVIEAGVAGVGVLLSAFYPDWLRQRRKFRVAIVLLILVMPFVDLVVWRDLSMHGALIGHLAVSILWAGIVSAAIASAWIKQFSNDQ